jgi:hypothetical protein
MHLPRTWAELLGVLDLFAVSFLRWREADQTLVADLIRVHAVVVNTDGAYQSAWAAAPNQGEFRIDLDFLGFTSLYTCVLAVGNPLPLMVVGVKV